MQTRKWNLIWKGDKTLWEKEKMLVTSIFSFSHNVFKSFLFHGSFQVGIVYLKGLNINECRSESEHMVWLTDLGLFFSKRTSENKDARPGLTFHLAVVNIGFYDGKFFCASEVWGLSKLCLLKERFEALLYLWLPCRLGQTAGWRKTAGLSPGQFCCCCCCCLKG